MKYINFLIKSFAAGVMIAIGGTVFLMVENVVIGAMLFSIGLFVIVSNELSLFTGKVGYIFENKLNYLFELLITILGNFLGTFVTALCLLQTRFATKLHPKASGLTFCKLADSTISIFILSIFCGALMFLAVNGHKFLKSSLGKHLSIFLCVSVFILSGFEHCVANMFYFSVSESWSIKSLFYLIYMILGNSVGAILFALLEKFCLRLRKVQ